MMGRKAQSNQPGVLICACGNRLWGASTDRKRLGGRVKRCSRMTCKQIGSLQSTMSREVCQGVRAESGGEC